MTTLTILGAGNIAQAVTRIAVAGGHQVQILARDAGKAAEAAAVAGGTSGVLGDPLTGDVVVAALPHPALAEVLGRYAGQLAGKVLVDPTNPVDFATFDSLVVPADGSSAAQVQERYPQARVLKAFNTNFAATLATGRVDDRATTVLVAGDDTAAKELLLGVVRDGGLEGVDAGALRRARELEALGFLQLTLAAGERIGWTGGFAVVR